MSDEEWRKTFSTVIRDVGDGMSFSQSSQRLREIIRTDLLQITDIIRRPERFFEAHRLLAKHATRLGPGFWIRFSVHFNLFAGTVVGVGTDQQLSSLVQRNKVNPRLGCFALTECLAGVNSGLVVQTTATFTSDGFIINTPLPSAAKNWISQGLVADEAVVIATLFVKGKSYGAQAFLVELRDASGAVNPCVVAEDMGRKTVGNDLDNARLTFHDFKIPLDSLLARFIRVSSDGFVEISNNSLTTMDMIGQRLFSGRVAVAQAALQFTKTLFSATRSFADNKSCWVPGNRRQALSAVPQIRNIFDDGVCELARLTSFLAQIESSLCVCLRSGKLPPLPLQHAIAVAKVKAVENSIRLCFALKQEVGSYALMSGTGFEQLDFLQCCKFAEGDSRILMQKMSRDIVRAGFTQVHECERAALKSLVNSLKKHTQDDGMDSRAAWDASWRLVYALAETHMQRVLQAYGYAANRAKI